MNFGKGVLSGYKTYIVAFLTVITALANYLGGIVDVSLADTAQLIITAVLGATVRAGVKSETAKIKDEA